MSVFLWRRMSLPSCPRLPRCGQWIDRAYQSAAQQCKPTTLRRNFSFLRRCVESRASRIDTDWGLCSPYRPSVSGVRREANLPAQPDPSCTSARVPFAHEVSGRAKDPRTTPQQGPAPSSALAQEEVGFPPAVSVRPGALRGSLRRADFLRATRQGRRFATEYFLLYVFDRKDSGPARLGITVTRKVGNAVRRNRIKRLVREWYRHTQAHSDALVGCDLRPHG